MIWIAPVVEGVKECFAFIGEIGCAKAINEEIPKYVVAVAGELERLVDIPAPPSEDSPPEWNPSLLSEIAENFFSGSFYRRGQLAFQRGNVDRRPPEAHVVHQACARTFYPGNHRAKIVCIALSTPAVLENREASLLPGRECPLGTSQFAGQVALVQFHEGKECSLIGRNTDKSGALAFFRGLGSRLSDLLGRTR